MAGPGAGFEHPREKVTWTKRDVLLFANSIGCTTDELHFLYELHPKFAVFPTYAVILPFKKSNTEVTNFYASSAPGAIPGIPKLDYTRVVDGERRIQFLKPLPTTSESRNFELRAKVIGVYDKGKATVVETEQSIVDTDTDEVYVRMVGSAFFVGQGGWGGPKGPETKGFPSPTDKGPGKVVVSQLTPEAAHLYRLNGDYNPLHATPEPGKKMGFGGAIMHGLCSWNMAAHVLLKELGGSDPANLKEFQARFASPVLPGARLETEMWNVGEKDGDGFEEVRFTMRMMGKDGKGKAVLSNGRARIRCVDKEAEGAKSKL